MTTTDEATHGTPTTVLDAVVGLLRATGMTTVFGNPGSTELRMFRDWPDDFRYVLGLQESTAVGMAAGHSLGTGRAAFVSLHSAGGVGNALGAVFNAYRDRVPLVIVAGQQARSLIQLRPFLGVDEPAQFPRPYVKFSRQPERAEDVPAVLAEAHRVAMTHPRGPVFVSVPEDDWDRAAAQPVEPRAVHTDFTASPDALAALAARLDSCARPALVVGPGVDDEAALPEALALAERIRAGVWISPLSGRSGFPESHPLFQGFLPPVAGQLAARLAPYDVVVALGTPVFTYHVVDDSPPLAPGTELFHLDCDPAQAAWLPTGTSLVTTLRPALTQLAALVGESDREPPPPRVRPHPVSVADSSHLTPELVLDELYRRLPRDRVLVEEAPSHRDALHARVPVDRSGGFLTTGSGALGWGLPLAVGRALADHRRVVCVLGDGSAMYSVQALWTAARHRAPVSFIVLDNGGYGAVRALGRRIGIDPAPGTDIGGIEFAALAASFGCAAHYADRPEDLGKALDRAVTHLGDEDGPHLLHLKVAGTEGTLYEPWAR
ncbi:MULTISPECIES: benzoylformate decarboxylase [unclassified Streptomyces]|uniref:benzoylformate decarboxylase n=1 Tax=unclassified Streptomyces TaxID=2593676 RepID=UPI002E17207C|nr:MULTISPECIES: benzoylformate decarboxylase [unclassified Streptomyces]